MELNDNYPDPSDDIYPDDYGLDDYVILDDIVFPDTLPEVDANTEQSVIDSVNHQLKLYGVDVVAEDLATQLKIKQLMKE